MATLFYGVMGEGRGHAARARAMVERLRARLRVVLFTSGDALEFLRREYSGDAEVEIHEVPGLKFHYSGDRLDNTKTIREGIDFWARAEHRARALLPAFDALRPALVVSDFEPLLPRAARRAGVPVVSLDHQHFLSTYDLRSLPGPLQRWAWAMTWAIWAMRIGPSKTVVSAFYHPPLRRGCEHVVQVGPLLRPAVRERSPSVGPWLLSYLRRRATPPRTLEMLAASPLPVRVYGLGARPPMGSAEFREIDERSFLDDLSGCDAVVSAAGNQLLGEALYFGKPVLALPEENHHEQRINACFLAQMGAGEWRTVEAVTPDDFMGFLGRREEHRARLAQTPRERFDGVEPAAAAIESMLPAL